MSMTRSRLKTRIGDTKGLVAMAAVWLPRAAAIVMVCVLVGSLVSWRGTEVGRGGKRERPSEEVMKAAAGRLSSLRAHAQGYEIVNETDVYQRYAKVYDRVVRYPDGQSFAFDVWGRNWRADSFAVVIIVPYDVETNSVTLIKEYNVAHHRFVYSFPTGMVDPRKHKSPQDAAEQELDEEAQLTCNSLIDLLNEDAIDGVPQDKYQRERVYMYLCVDDEEDDDPNDRDSEESDLQIERRVPVAEVKVMLRSGAFQSNNVAAAYLAFEELETRGYRLA